MGQDACRNILPGILGLAISIKRWWLQTGNIAAHLTEPNELMNEKPTNTYDARVGRVCTYIFQNLDSELPLDSLCDIAAFSKFHFHRVFLACVGISVTRFIQLARLKRASFRLAFENELRIIDIAFEAGFDSPEAFTRAFRRTFQQSPSEFRANPAWSSWHTQFQFNVPPPGVTTVEVKIIHFEKTSVALLEHLGPPDRVYDTAAKFIRWRKETGLSPVKTSKTFGIPYGDPELITPEKFRWDVCGSIDGDVPENAYGVKAGSIPGGRCAVVRHQGSHDSLKNSIYYLYRDWLPGSGEETRDFPIFFHYLNLVHEVDECDLLTDIYLPLK